MVSLLYFNLSCLVDPHELLLGLANVLHISFSREETNLLLNHLDEDKSGDIDYREFASKISLNNLHSNSHTFLISEHRFIEYVLSEWYDYRKAQIKELVKLIEEFDADGNGVMDFDEF